MNACILVRITAARRQDAKILTGAINAFVGTVILEMALLVLILTNAKTQVLATSLPIALIQLEVIHVLAAMVSMETEETV